MDFDYYEIKHVSFSDVTQLIMRAEYRDARQGFAAYAERATRHLIDKDGVIKDLDATKALIRSAFRSTYDVVGHDYFASFLSLDVGSSLSIVMDTTDGMADDIAAAKSRVVKIIERTNGTISAPLNYVLMPYNDPGYGPLTRTSDPTKFTDAFDSLSTSGGRYEPDLSMIGIQKAAQSSELRSFVYLFTDAPAEDEFLRDNVIALCLTKKITVFVFLTFNIATWKRQVYDDIARSTGGNVLYVPKTDIYSASAIMEETTVQGLVTLKVGSTNLTSFSLDVDSTISSLLVQFIGDFSYQSVDGPGIVKVESLVSIAGAELFRIEDIAAGRYTFHVKKNVNNSYGILIRGVSGFGFHAKLQQINAESGELITGQQFFAGLSTKAEMTIYGDDADGTFKTFQLISRDGDILIEREVEKQGNKFYVTKDEFILPVQPSVVRLIGTYNEMPLVRVDPCTITPTVSSSILNDIADLTVKAGKTIEVSTVLKNIGATDSFTVVVSDNRDYVVLSCLSHEGSSLKVTLDADESQTITLSITVPSDVTAGVLSKVVLSATALNGNYFIFTTFVISVIDDVIRCSSPITPIGGRLLCSPDSQSVGSKCTLLCGDEYDLKGVDTISCQADGTWFPKNPGQCSLLGSKTCKVAGDPHYTTFDGRRFDFQGSCLYTMIETIAGSGVEPITIQTENGHFYRKTHVAWFQQAFITVYGVTIHLKLGKIVLIDGVRVILPRFINGGRLQILYDGPDVLVKTDFKLEARLNKKHTFRVTLPPTYRNAVFGLCGNYDGVRNNDLQVDNQSVRPSKFGNALEVVGGSKPWCRQGTPEDDESGCNEAQKAVYSEKCAALKSSCFEGCADNVTVEEFFQECVFDMCALDGNEAVYEEHVSDFASYCSERRIQICNWREEFDFPLPPCGQNQHYTFEGNRCPNTCVNPQAASRCTSKPKVEGCICNEGFVLDGTKCVHLSECGCADSGAYYQNGFSFVERNCKQRCVCTNAVLTCTPFSCEEGTVCGIVSGGQYGCVVERIDKCHAVGDPHYRTLDGSYYDFMGVCRYVMLTTNGTTFTDNNRHITVTAQNEHRNGQTSVSYVRSVRVELPGNIQVEFGPGDSWKVTRPENDTSDIVTLDTQGGQKIAKTKYGITVKFNGHNLFIDVPNFYMNKVAGLCGNYTGVAKDDFGGMSVKAFANSHRHSDGCNADETLPEPFVCSPEAMAKWSGPEYCGRMKASDGPFLYCLPFVDISNIVEACIFDACATDGQTVNSSFYVLAEECEKHLPCDWEVRLGVAPSCPINSEYICGSTCQDSCRNPTASAQCESDEEFAQCVCMPGFILNDGACVEASSCGCVLEDGSYVLQGFFHMATNCSFSLTCTGPGSTTVVEEPCTDDSKCLEVEEGQFQCISNEIAYSFVYGGVHFKTFDNYYFDFRGNCAYLLAAHDSDTADSPSFRIYIVTRGADDGRIDIEEVIMEGWMHKRHTFVFRVGKDLTYTFQGIRYPVGATIDLLTVKWIRGNLAFEFNVGGPGAQVHYNGKDWVRVDAPLHLAKRMYGMGVHYNHDKNGDLVVDDVNTTLTLEAWGDLWLREDQSSMECSKRSPPEDFGCLLKVQYQRSCYCGMIKDVDGPFSACHAFINPEPFMNACVSDACYYGGSTLSMIGIMKAYRLACIGKGIFIRFESFSEIALEAAACPENSHFSNCTGPSQPTCTSRKASYLTRGCEDGCVCDDGFIMSGRKCIPIEKCGCLSERGVYLEHGTCDTNEDCTKTCNCVYGEWNCEEMTCSEEQVCSIMDGVRGCHCKDPCKYDNGGCSDMCSHNDEYEVVCSCDSGRLLTKDNKTCIEISPTYFEDSVQQDSCGVGYTAWKNEYKNWQDVYLPRLQKELKEYEDYVNKNIVSAGNRP